MPFPVCCSRCPRMTAQTLSATTIEPAQREPEAKRWQEEHGHDENERNTFQPQRPRHFVEGRRERREPGLEITEVIRRTCPTSLLSKFRAFVLSCFRDSIRFTRAHTAP